MLTFTDKREAWDVYYELYCKVNRAETKLSKLFKSFRDRVIAEDDPSAQRFVEQMKKVVADIHQNKLALNRVVHYCAENNIYLPYGIVDDWRAEQIRAFPDGD